MAEVRSSDEDISKFSNFDEELENNDDEQAESANDDV